jgi:hypothetical protein
MKPVLIALISSSLLALTACASITDGTSQALIFKLDPKEARCVLTREGTELGSVSGAQPTISVGKSSRDIVVACKADGYASKTMRLVSSTQAAGVVGGVFLDLGITDMITGAMWKYQNEISVILEREGVVAGQASSGVPAPAAIASAPVAAPVPAAVQ